MTRLKCYQLCFKNTFICIQTSYCSLEQRQGEERVYRLHYKQRLKKDTNVYEQSLLFSEYTNGRLNVKKFNQGNKL